MKKQGFIQLSRHLIGQRKPIVACLGVSALYGCGGDSTDYTLYTMQRSCDNAKGAELCATVYEKAQAEARRTAMRYYSQRSCEQDYGNVCIEEQGVWQPRMAGFVTWRNDNNFALPFFTSVNPRSSHFGYAFLADGEILGKFRDADKAQVSLSEKYIQPLATSILDPQEPMIEQGQRTERSALGTLAQAYILSEVIDETGDYLTERERSKRYKECMQRNGDDCYRISSGSGRVSTPTTGGTYRKSEPKLSKKQVKTYKSSPKVTTTSKGGFGRTGSVRGGFGS